jgi:hypothetical protein
MKQFDLGSSVGIFNPVEVLKRVAASLASRYEIRGEGEIKFSIFHTPFVLFWVQPPQSHGNESITVESKVVETEGISCIGVINMS